MYDVILLLWHFSTVWLDRVVGSVALIVNSDLNVSSARPVIASCRHGTCAICIFFFS